LYGPPGTGKTRLAYAVAKEIDSPFYSASCSDILSSWFGESEKTLRSLFDHARKGSKRCVVAVLLLFCARSILGSKNLSYHKPTHKLPNVAPPPRPMLTLQLLVMTDKYESWRAVLSGLVVHETAWLCYSCISNLTTAGWDRSQAAECNRLQSISYNVPHSSAMQCMNSVAICCYATTFFHLGGSAGATLLSCEHHPKLPAWVFLKNMLPKLEIQRDAPRKYVTYMRS